MRGLSAPQNGHSTPVATPHSPACPKTAYYHESPSQHCSTVLCAQQSSSHAALALVTAIGDSLRACSTSTCRVAVSLGTAAAHLVMVPMAEQTRVELRNPCTSISLAQERRRVQTARISDRTMTGLFYVYLAKSNSNTALWLHTGVQQRHPPPPLSPCGSRQTDGTNTEYFSSVAAVTSRCPCCEAQWVGGRAHQGTQHTACEPPAGSPWRSRRPHGCDVRGCCTARPRRAARHADGPATRRCRAAAAG